MDDTAARNGRVARSIEVVARRGSATARIEHVKRRKVLRLTARDDRGQLDPLEIALPGLLERLDIDPTVISAPVRYLLFAGLHGQALGGADDLVGTFDQESDARRAFHDLRARMTDSEGWGDLTALDVRGRLTHLAWFGRDQVSASLADRARPARRPRFRSRPRTLSLVARSSTAV